MFTLQSVQDFPNKTVIFAITQKNAHFYLQVCKKKYTFASAKLLMFGIQKQILSALTKLGLCTEFKILSN